MAKTRKMKECSSLDIRERLNVSNGAIIAEYRGMSVPELVELRVKLRQANAEFQVCKNRVAIYALGKTGEDFKALKSYLRGPVGIVYLKGDVAAGAKVLVEFAKDHSKLSVVGGALDGAGMTKVDVNALADLPPREVLLGRLVGTLIAPHRGLMTVLSGVQRNLVYVINAIKEKK